MVSKSLAYATKKKTTVIDFIVLQIRLRYKGITFICNANLFLIPFFNFKLAKRVSIQHHNRHRLAPQIHAQIHYHPNIQIASIEAPKGFA